ncbi:MAG: hypothetical protein EBV45_16260 [Chloroflexi bacterium]|nr:hypothetical protein [Chloroflexota bacterium]
MAGIVFLFFACLYASTTGAIGYSVDGQFSYRVARDMAKRGVPLAAHRSQRRWGPVMRMRAGTDRHVKAKIPRPGETEDASPTPPHATRCPYASLPGGSP